jgi:glyoxylate/hydroxypyruvate reductase A
MSGKRSAIVYKSDPVRGEVWRQVFAAELPDVAFRMWPETGPAEDVEYLVAWIPPLDLATTFPRLKVLFGIGAGIDQLDLAVVPSSVAVVRTVDPELTRSMVEYALFGVLALHRDMPFYLKEQQSGRWSPKPVVQSRNRVVGIMGLGVLGKAVATTLADFGFAVRGWSASPKSIPGITSFTGGDQLPAFLSACNILVCLLPLTDQTRGIVASTTLDLLPRGASLVNIGRGSHVAEADLLTALQSGRISCAILDVLGSEPPDPDDPLFRHPNVLVTPHIASTTHPDSAARQVIAAIKRHRAGLPLDNAIDRDRGY